MSKPKVADLEIGQVYVTIVHDIPGYAKHLGVPEDAVAYVASFLVTDSIEGEVGIELAGVSGNHDADLVLDSIPDEFVTVTRVYPTEV